MNSKEIGLNDLSSLVTGLINLGKNGVNPFSLKMISKKTNNKSRETTIVFPDAPNKKVGDIPVIDKKKE